MTAGQAIELLNAAAPVWHPPTIPSSLHELRLWGIDSQFTPEMVGSPREGMSVVRMLLDDEACQRETVQTGGAFLLDSPYGVRVALLGVDSRSGERAEAHFGQLLKSLAEGGAPSTADVVTCTGKKATIADILRDAVMRYSPDQEQEFIAVALALWLPPTRQWNNAFGEVFSFDDVIAALINKPMGEGACGGCHVPYAVVQILRADEQHRVLSPRARERGIAWLRSVEARLEQTRLPTGGWDGTWAGNGGTAHMWSDSLLDRITVTGHHLEWIALWPADAALRDQMISQAAESLVSDCRALVERRNQPFKIALPLTHAARALTLLRGEEAWPAWYEAWRSGRILSNAVAPASPSRN